MNTIVGWNSIIGSWTRVEGSREPDSKGKNNFPKSNNYHFYLSFWHVESLCILGVGVAIDPELCIRNCIVLPYKELSENHSNEVIL